MEAQLAQKRRYDTKVKPREFYVGQKLLLLLPSSSEKLLVKWQGPFKIVAKTGDVDYDIEIPHIGRKKYVNLLKAWSEAPDLEHAYDAFLGVEADIDWDEEGQLHIQELQQQIEEGIAPSAWQTRQIDQVIREYPDAFADTPGAARGVVHTILMEPGVVVRSPSRSTPLARQKNY